MKDKNRKLFVEYKEGVNYLYREPTEEELNEALKIEKRRELLEKRIEKSQRELDNLYENQSTVFYDEPGFPYDVRFFVASGRTSLI